MQVPPGVSGSRNLGPRNLCNPLPPAVRGGSAQLQKSTPMDDSINYEPVVQWEQWALLVESTRGPSPLSGRRHCCPPWRPGRSFLWSRPSGPSTGHHTGGALH